MFLRFSLVFLFLVNVSLFSQQIESEEGRKAPNFILEDMDGEFVELKELIGEGPVLIAFWATWCKPCVEELAEYEKLYDEFGSKGLQFIGISTDNERSVAKVKPYVKSKGYDFMVLLDTNSEVARKYYAQAVPYSVIIDKYGNIVYQHLGYAKGDEIYVRKIITELLEGS